ncbi:MAG: hypothetical protein CW716_01200 [Candidatus Bathyarchaeum sp.]|nr:MAG: hypothetical protein CW716_01200 [Candidatus Bathyarchaeum sp.]
MKALTLMATGKLHIRALSRITGLNASRETKRVIEVKIDYRRCINCKKCVESCTFGVLEWFEDQPIVTNPSICSSCLKCELSCSVGAINIKAK